MVGVVQCQLDAQDLPERCYWDLAIEVPRGVELDFRGMNFEVGGLVGSPDTPTTYHLKGYSICPGEDFVTVVQASLNAFMAKAQASGIPILDPGDHASIWDHINDEE